MKLNDNLNYEADKYAKQLFQRFGGTGRLKHSPRDSRKGQGENLASGCTTARGRDGRTVEDAAKSWFVTLTNLVKIHNRDFCVEIFVRFHVTLVHFHDAILDVICFFFVFFFYVRNSVLKMTQGFQCL